MINCLDQTSVTFEKVCKRFKLVSTCLHVFLRFIEGFVYKFKSYEPLLNHGEVFEKCLLKCLISHGLGNVYDFSKMKHQSFKKISELEVKKNSNYFIFGQFIQL